MAVAELQRTNSVLRQLDRNKLDFIQVAAHELRTPLTVLSGYIEILRSFPEVRSNPKLGEAIDRYEWLQSHPGSRQYDAGCYSH